MNLTVENKTSSPPLAAAAFDRHSQNGEDGIIEEILRRLDRLAHDQANPLWCVEFGAWDGVYLSNTRHLIEARDAHAVLIEPNDDRYHELLDNTAQFPGVHTINCIVSSQGETRLDALLAPTPCPHDFDVLSIDIDGHDYWAWDSLNDYQPLIVVIEYNPTIPYEVPYRSPNRPDQRHGSSLSAIAQLGDRKGYTLVAATETNAILVRTDRVRELQLEDTSIAALTQDLTDYRTFLFATPDGRVKIAGNRVLMWHGVVYDENKVQPLPKCMQRHHDAMGPIRQRILRYMERRSRSRFERSLEKRQTRQST